MCHLYNFVYVFGVKLRMVHQLGTLTKLQVQHNANGEWTILKTIRKRTHRSDSQISWKSTTNFPVAIIESIPGILILSIIINFTINICVIQAFYYIKNCNVFRIVNLYEPHLFVLHSFSVKYKPFSQFMAYSYITHI